MASTFGYFLWKGPRGAVRVLFGYLGERIKGFSGVAILRGRRKPGHRK